MKPVRLIWVVLIAAGIIAGTWSDRPRDQPPRELGGYRVVEADFHVHSFLGDGVLSPMNVVLEARRRGLHAFALTNHNQVIAAKLARWYSRLIDGPIVLIGQEITAPGYHLAAAGIHRTVSWRQPATAAIRDVHDQGGIAIAAHPVAAYWPQLTADVVSRLDGAEVAHPLVYVDAAEKQELRQFFHRARETNPGLAAIGSSDFHALRALGICRTLAFVDRLDESGILEAIRAGRTVVFDEDGHPHGDAELIQLLATDPSPASLSKSREGRRSIQVAGVLAWIGLVGLLLVRDPRPDEANSLGLEAEAHQKDRLLSEAGGSESEEVEDSSV